MSGHSAPDRREFLHRGMRAFAAVGAAWAAGGLLALRGRRARATGAQVRIPDFSVPGGKKMSIVSGTDRRKTLARALEALGGIGAFIGRGDRVLLKVNAAFATPAALSATTNPELAAELVRLCFQAGASSVRVVDNSINDPESCFALSGLGPAVRKAGGEVVMPRRNLFRPVSLKGGKLIRNWPVLAVPLEGADKLIGIAPVKHHNRSGASMTIKNWYGLLGGRRNRFHQDINGIISELARLVRPTFVVLDGTTTMMTNGPTGGSLADLKATNTLVVSTDHVAADAFGAGLLGLKAADLPYLGLAQAAGAGTADYGSLNPKRGCV